MTGVVIHVPQARTPRQILQAEVAALECGRRPATRLPGGWIADIVAQRQTVLLCDACDRSWRPGAWGYRIQFEATVYGKGRCDGCRSELFPVKVWIAEEVFHAIGRPKPARRGRWAMVSRLVRPRHWF